jgi:hypothetical protein
MRCFLCDGDVIWNSDFDAEELGYTDFTVVSFYTCMDCKSEFEVCTGPIADGLDVDKVRNIRHNSA